MPFLEVGTVPPHLQIGPLRPERLNNLPRIVKIVDSRIWIPI